MPSPDALPDLGPKHKAVACHECGRVLSFFAPGTPTYPSQGEGGPSGARYWCEKCRPPMEAPRDDYS